VQVKTQSSIRDAEHGIALSDADDDDIVSDKQLTKVAVLMSCGASLSITSTSIPRHCSCTGLTPTVHCLSAVS